MGVDVLKVDGLGVDVLKLDVMALPRSVYIKQSDKRNNAALLFFPCHTCMKIKTLAFDDSTDI